MRATKPISPEAVRDARIFVACRFEQMARGCILFLYVSNNSRRTQVPDCVLTGLPQHDGANTQAAAFRSDCDTDFPFVIRRLVQPDCPDWFVVFNCNQQYTLVVRDDASQPFFVGVPLHGIRHA